MVRIRPFPFLYRTPVLEPQELEGHPSQVPSSTTHATPPLPVISGCTTRPIHEPTHSPPVQQVEQIIPNEDPQRPVDLGEDDDDDDEGDGDGIGSEDLDEAEGDEGDDEGDPNQVPAGPDEKPRTQRPLPEWLLLHFHLKVAERTRKGHVQG